MKNLKQLSFAILLISTAQFTFAQDMKPCSTDEMVARSLQANPSLMADYLAEEARLAQIDQEEFLNGYKNENRAMLPVYTIPVVFHIIHLDGTENISDAQVRDAMRVLNEDYRKMNADFANTVPAFQPIAADCEVEFQLAKKDPSGNCTNGIDRIYSTETLIGDDGSKLNQWPRSKYLNIWVVRTISSGAAGYSYYPGTTMSVNDGISTLSSYVGAIGTGSVTRSHALGHEVGHYLNLKHCWGSTNSPGVDCSGTDNVTDTPPTKGWTSCNLAGISCGTVQENVQNFMEYSYCCTMFTEGQKTRLRAALTSSVSQRSSLWSASNLAATGVSAPAVLCQARFTSNRISTNNIFCAGNDVTFTDESWNGTPNSWLWSFPGGTPSSSTSPNPTITYNTPGLYDVTLSVTDSAGTVTTTSPGYINVKQTTAMFSSPTFSESFESITVPNYEWNVRNKNSGTNTWVQTTGAGATGSNSMMITNLTSSVENVDDLIGPSLDMTAFGSSPVLTFKVAHAQRSSTSADKLQFYVSTNCGQTWILRKSVTGASLSTAGVQSTSFTPGTSQWVTHTVSLSSFSGETNLYFMFRFTSDGGNNIYLDDINVAGAVGMEELSSTINLQLFPNPSEGNSTLSFDLEKKSLVSVQVLDMTGRQISNEHLGTVSSGHVEIPVSSETDLAPGIYMIRLNVDGSGFTRKLIIQ